MGFKQHKLSYDKTKQIKKKQKKNLHHRLKYTHKDQISARMKASPPFALNTVKTPSHFCVLVGTVFALGNQIWPHTFGLTQGGWPMGFTGPPLSPIYLGKVLLSVVWREGRLLPVGGRLIPQTPHCYGLWHTYVHKTMPVLSYIQMGQSVIVVTRGACLLYSKKTSPLLPLHTHLIRHDQFHCFICSEDLKVSPRTNKEGREKKISFSHLCHKYVPIFGSRKHFFLCMELSTNSWKSVFCQ